MELISGKTLRIIDANLNRIGEGLRFLEEIARLLLDDAGLTQQLKNMRHELVRSEWPFERQLLQARNSVGDVGIDIEAAGEGKQKELSEALVANSRRVQEALRVVEELAKTPGITLEPDRFKRARFAIYEIEKTLLSRMLRRDRKNSLVGLHVIIDTQALRGRSHIQVTEQAIRGGATIIQLRDKLRSKKDLLPVAQELRNLCSQRNVVFIVNDYLDIALAVDADGLHLGQDDLPIREARKLLPIGKILGGSAINVGQAAAAQADGADYIGAGAIYPTASKEAAGAIGLEGLRQIRQAVTLPLVAIGGINRDNVSEVLAAGADSVAVINAVLGAEDVEEASRQIADMIRGKHDD